MISDYTDQLERNSEKRLIFKRILFTIKKARKNRVEKTFFEVENLNRFIIHVLAIIVLTALALVLPQTNIQNLIYPLAYSACLTINDKFLKQSALFLALCALVFYMIADSLNEFKPIPGLNYELSRLICRLVVVISSLYFYASTSLKIKTQRSLLKAKERNIRTKIIQSKEFKAGLQSANRKLYSSNKKLHLVANDNLRQLDTFLEAINSNIPLSVTDVNGIILEVNDPFCELCKYSRHELIGISHSILDGGHHQRKFFTDFWNTILAGRKWKGEMRNKAGDGSLYWIDLVVIGLQDKQGNIEKFISLQFPITEKMDFQEQNGFYIKSLEEMAFLTSHKLRRPVTNIAGLVNILEDITLLDQAELKNIVNFLSFTAGELEKFTVELNDFICKEIKSKAPELPD